MQEERNKKKILDLVENYFSIEHDSFKVFQDRLINGFNSTDEINSFFEGTEDNRRYFKIEETEYKHYDIGWENFNTCFATIVTTYDINYNDFAINKKTYNKNVYKIPKLIVEFFATATGVDFAKAIIELYSFLDNKIEYSSTSYRGIEELRDDLDRKDISRKTFDVQLMMRVEKATNVIGASKISALNGELYLVITKNFADWFMCSTGENWSSCLCFESEYPYWGGLPGLIGDPNRVMAYVTDKSKKEYKGIEVDKMISRTWIIQDEDNEFHHLLWYPSKMFKNKILRKLSGLKVIEFRQHEWTSKLPLVPIYHEGGKSAFPYQDATCFDVDEDDEDKNIYVVGCPGGQFSSVDKWGQIYDDDLFEWDCGLSELMDSGGTLETESGGRVYCESCGERMDEDDAYFTDNETLCSDCYHETHFVCEECNGMTHEDEMVTTGDQTYICQHCYEQHYFTCEKSDEVFPHGEARNIIDEFGDEVMVSQEWLDDEGDEYPWDGSFYVHELYHYNKEKMIYIRKEWEETA